MVFIRQLKEVEAHGTIKLHVIHTNDLKKVEETINHYEMHLKYQSNKIIGVDVEYTDEPAHTQKAALVQLSVGKTQPVLLFQLSAAEDKCMVFDNFLADTRYTFVGFSIDQDIEKLDCIGLEIGHFMDIQKEWRVPESTKYLDSLGDVSSMLIDDYYIDMKYKMPLAKKHIEYAEKDAYAAYEIWRLLTVIQDRLGCAKLEKSKKRTRNY